MLERYELRDMFQGHGWEILHDKVATDSDHGRSMIHFVAVKQAATATGVDDDHEDGSCLATTTATLAENKRPKLA